MKTLRAHQVQAISLVRESIKQGNRKVMVALPTGAGKTVIAAEIIRQARAKGKRVIFCVNAISLVNQTVKAFWDEGIQDIGVMQGAHELENRNHPVQVCSVQTLMRRRIPPADLVIIDEAHNWYAFYERWFEKWNAVPFIGLSATPWTKGLGAHYDDLVIAETTQGLIDKGYLSDFKVYAPSHPDMEGVRTRMGDYVEEDISRVMSDNALIADIVDTWKRLGRGRPTLCYGVNRVHAKHMQKQFMAAGVACGYIDAYTEMEERTEISNKFHSGELEVVCNVGVLTTGIDWDVRCIILARPTKSEILFVQIIGRGLRTADGKSDCLILDHSDTHLRLGFVTDIQHEGLHDGSRAERVEREAPEKLPKECQQCHFLKPAGVFVCPACGHKPEPQNKVDHGDGTLSQLTRGKQSTPQEKDQFMRELLGHAVAMGYKEGWAHHKYQQRYKEWRSSPAEPVAPSPETLSYIKHLQIKFHAGKMKGKRGAK